MATDLRAGLRQSLKTSLKTGLVGATGGGFDADATAYIAAVEAADGAALEDSVKIAINAFVVGCKADGTWNAIKASCILAGARTLSGALIPLAGTAPTNFNFVTGDYNRKTGLVGDGTSKYLVPNRDRNADPQNNAHAAVYINKAQSNNNLVVYLARQSSYVELTANNSTAYTGINSGGFVSTSISGKPTGIFGVTRANGSNETRRVNQISSTYASTSSAPSAGSPDIYRLPGTPPNYYINARLAFYSIGESIDLALLDARVTTLIAAYDAAIP
jgi:hypothetical protein